MASLPPEKRLGYNIKQTDQTIMSVKTQRLKELGLSVPQYAALMTLRDHPGISGVALAERCLTTPQAMAAQLKVMEANGWLERTTSAWAKNVSEINLTAAGKKLVAEADKRAGALEQAIYDSLSEAERQQLVALLAKCRATAQTTEF